jgi:hypothetical protein
MNLAAPETTPVSGAQLRVRFASIASMYAVRAAGAWPNHARPPISGSTEPPSNEGGAGTPTRSSVVGATSISRTSASVDAFGRRGPAHMIHGTRIVAS